MTSDDTETPQGTPLTRFTRALDDAEEPERDFPRNLHNPGQFSRDLYSSSTANEPHIAPLVSPTFTDIGIPPSSMVGNEHSHSMGDRNTEESTSEQLSQDVAQSPGILSHHSPSENAVYQGQHDQTHHHQYPHGPGYFGHYALSPHHVGVGHSPPPPFVYHGYHHHTFSPPAPQAQGPTYSYPVQASEDPSRHGSYQTPQMYSRPPVSPGAGQGSIHGPFSGGMYPSLHYSTHSEYAYRHPGYHPNSPPLYPSQYGQTSFQASVEPQGQATWWYMAPGPPLSSPPHLEVSRPYHPGFQRSYTYPFGALIPSATDSRHSSTSTPVPSHASPSSTSRAPPTQRGPNYNMPRAESSQLTALEDEEETSGAAGRPLVRRSYHPRPPMQRSDWTMWAGNVPPDATSNELWSFFSQLPSVSQLDTQPVVSVFLINRSSCAFINYDTEPHLNEAIEHFNSKSLRPSDSRCPKLLCRVRKKDDDLKTGVGAQRGTGMHTKWVKEQKAKRTDAEDAGSASTLVRVMSSLSLPSSDEEHRRRKKQEHSSSSGSYASSTTSSFLARNFPRRYFILKSLTQHDLDLSVEKGLWATQKHNEGVLDQAFRTSQEVLLIFGVNKSGEFYGFARMTSPIQSGEQQVAWETRKTSTPSSREAATQPFEEPPPLILSPSDYRVVTESPKAESSLGRINTSEITISDEVFDTDAKHVQTAPAEVGQRNRFSVCLPPARHTYEASRRPELDVIRLDPEAPKRAIRRRETIAEELAEEDEAKGGDQDEGYGDMAWGQSFKVEWLSTERLPFYRIRHLRNPWNHEREVKVSRDGTELEPIVGQQLVDEWHGLATAPGDSGPRASGKRNKTGR